MTRAYQPRAVRCIYAAALLIPVSQAGMAYLAHESEQTEQRTARHVGTAPSPTRDDETDLNQTGTSRWDRTGQRDV